MTEVLPAIVYGLCLLTSAACAWLLGRSYFRSRDRMLFWSCICFTFLAANNLVLVLDLFVWPEGDLSVLRSSLLVLAVTSLIWGFLWGEEDSL